MKQFFLLLCVLAVPCFALAGDDCSRTGQCEHCGCQACCQKYCHVVCEWKDVKEYVYSCQCKDVCIPGCSDKCCTKYQEQGCCELPYCPVIEGPKPLYSLWCPADCAKIRNVTKLYKTEVTRKVPTYKWVVEYCCDKCRCDIAANESTESNAPVADAKASDSAPEKAVPDAPQPSVPPAKVRLALMLHEHDN